MKTPEQQIAELKQSLAQAKQKKTLRDEFAMEALTGLFLHRANLLPDLVAIEAYRYADAMMKERSQ
jgi:hypothetical protein